MEVSPKIREMIIERASTADIKRQAIEEGARGGPYAYVVTLDDQNDASEAVELLEILRRGGVELQRASAAFDAGGRRYEAGSYVIPASQAFRAYLVDLLEKQDYPDRRLYPGGPPNPPYDISGWTLPMQMGVVVDRIDAPFDASLTSIDGKEIDPGRGGVAGEGEVLLLSPGENAGMRLVARLLAGESGGRARVSRTTTSFASSAFRQPSNSSRWPRPGGGARARRGRAPALDAGTSATPHRALQELGRQHG